MRNRTGEKTKLVLVLYLLIGIGIFSGGCRREEAHNWQLLTEETEGVSEKISGAGKKEREAFSEFTDRIFAEWLFDDGLTFHYLLKDPEKFFLGKEMAFEESERPKILGSYGIEEMKQSLAESENYKKQLESFSYERLSERQKLTYDVLEAYLLQDDMKEELLWYNEPIRPQSGIPVQLPVLLAEYTFYDREDIGDYMKLLESIEPYFSDILRFEQEKAEKGLFMSVDTAGEVIEKCEDFIAEPDENFLLDVFGEKLEKLILQGKLSEKEKKELCEKNREAVLGCVIPAYRLLIEGLKDLENQGQNIGGLCNYPDGKEYYEKAARVYTGSEDSVKELARRLDQTIADRKKEMRMSFLKEGAAKEYDAYQYPETEPEKILSYLKEQIKEAFPETLEAEYELNHVSKKMEEALSPAFYMTPPMDDYENNVIYLNESKIGEGNELFPTLAHEGYPGHLFQTVFFRNAKMDPVRYILNFPGYEEGWGTYAEAYSYQFMNCSRELKTILCDDLILSLCIYARVDIGVNYEGWTEDGVRSYLQKINLTDTSNAKELYQLSVSEPFLYLKYIAGYLEILKLKDEAKDEWDSYSEQKFHRFFLTIGPAPFSVLEEWLEEPE